MIVITFFAFTIVGYVLYQAFELQIRSLISGAFIARIFVLTGYKSKAKLYFSNLFLNFCNSASILFIGITTFYIMVLVFIALCPKPLAVNCDKNPSDI